MFAAPQAAPLTHTSAVSELAHVVLALLLVLAAIFVLARFVRIARNGAARRTDLLQVVADLPLGQKERAVLVRVGSTQILLGVAPGSVSALHVLGEPLESGSAAAAAPGPTFRDLLRRSLGK